MPRWILIAALLAGGPALAQDENTIEPNVERAREASRQLASDLMTRLMAAMQEGGTTGAVETCAEVAQEIAEKHSVDGLTIRRVSLKARNPADEPDAFERGQLEALQEMSVQGQELPKEVVEVVDGGRTLRYLRPIVVQAPCLRCHGQVEDVDPEVRRSIESHYPDDKAMGYKVGDLRGAFSVQVLLTKPPPNAGVDVLQSRRTEPSPSRRQERR